MVTAGCGRLVVVSGPSGVGKTTLLARVLERRPVALVRSVSATTRPPRPGEIDGRDYHFLTEEQFQSLRRRGEFVECFEVFGQGQWYGTLQSEVATGLRTGKWVVLNIDVQGGLAVTERYPRAITIFVRAGSLDELARRLRGRGTESEEAIARRLAQAQEEMAMAERYCYQVVNDDMEQAVDEMCQILTTEAQKATVADCG